MHTISIQVVEPLNKNFEEILMFSPGKSKREIFLEEFSIFGKLKSREIGKHLWKVFADYSWLIVLLLKNS